MSSAKPVEPTFDGYENNHQVPAHVVLSVAHAVRAFRQGLLALPIEREAYIEHYISDAFSYMQDPDETQQYIEHFQLEARERLQDRYEPQVVQCFGELLALLCAAIHSELHRANAWDINGVLWFTFDRLIGDDIVLRRTTLDEVAKSLEHPPFGTT